MERGGRQAANLSKNVLFQKKKKKKKNGAGTWNFPFQGYFEETMWSILPSTPLPQKSGNSNGVQDRATPGGISMGLGFSP